MDFVAVALAALGASALTMFSGFGLGTLLMPVFALFVPAELAVGATAVVHGANGFLKASMFGRRAHLDVVLRFGLPSAATAFAGAWLLGRLASSEPLFAYVLLGRMATVSPLKLVMAALIAGFAGLELHPRFQSLAIDRRYLPLGGILSGFFGGVSGHQGALRAAFLSKLDLTPPAFVGTSAVIGLLVDLTRLAVYAVVLPGGSLNSPLTTRQEWLIGIGVVAAMAGVFLGKRLLAKVTMVAIQRVTGGMLIAIAALLGAGLI